jgi:hypothetical protein
MRIIGVNFILINTKYLDEEKNDVISMFWLILAVGLVVTPQDISAIITLAPPLSSSYSSSSSSSPSSSPLPPTNGHSLSGASSGLVVRTAQGLVRGLASRGTRQWLSVPYAAPPIGPLRY